MSKLSSLVLTGIFSGFVRVSYLLLASHGRAKASSVLIDRIRNYGHCFGI